MSDSSPFLAASASPDEFKAFVDQAFDHVDQAWNPHMISRDFSVWLRNSGLQTTSQDDPTTTMYLDLESCPCASRLYLTLMTDYTEQGAEFRCIQVETVDEQKLALVLPVTLDALIKAMQRALQSMAKKVTRCEVKDCGEEMRRVCTDTDLIGKELGCLGRLCEAHQNTTAKCSFCSHASKWQCALCNHVWQCTFCYDG